MKRAKKMVLYLFGFLLLLCVGITLFINLDPAFGGNPTKEQKETYKHFENYVNGKFVNEVPTGLGISSSDSLSTNKDIIVDAKDRNPVIFLFPRLIGTKLKVKKIV